MLLTSNMKKELMAELQIIVDEKITKVNGETTIRKYSKGRFLGKVLQLKQSREDLHVATNSLTLKLKKLSPPKLSPKLPLLRHEQNKR